MNRTCSCQTSSGDRALSSRIGSSAERAIMLPMSSKRSPPPSADAGLACRRMAAGVAVSALVRARVLRLGFLLRRGEAMVVILDLGFTLCLVNVLGAIGLQGNGFRGSLRLGEVLSRQTREDPMSHACYCVTKHNAPLERMDCPTPEPRGAEVLVRMTAAGVCHSDIHIWEGVYDLGSGNRMTLKDRGVTLPLTMGHEISGEVVKVGPDAKSVTAGLA